MENNLNCEKIILRTKNSDHHLLPNIHWYGCNDQNCKSFYNYECHEIIEFGKCPLKDKL